ncbi:MAG: low affinity iron permease family protein [Gemmatimonadaceae bacterium]
MIAKFHRLAAAVARATGSAWAFIAALVVIVLWGVVGPAYGYSNTWQLVINTGTTIVTFLMVFLIQNTQNRDAYVVHLKLDELIRAVAGARNTLVGMEHLSDAELQRLETEFEALRAHAATRRAQRNALRR